MRWVEQMSMAGLHARTLRSGEAARREKHQLLFGKNAGGSKRGGGVFTPGGVALGAIGTGEPASGTGPGAAGGCARAFGAGKTFGITGIGVADGNNGPGVFAALAPGVGIAGPNALGAVGLRSS